MRGHRERPARGWWVRALGQVAPCGARRGGSAAHSVLTGRRSVLLEFSGEGAAPRERVRLLRLDPGVRIAVAAAPDSAAARLTHGDAVTVVAPANGSRWRFATHVIGASAAPSAAAILLGWPDALERAAGRRFPRTEVMCPAQVRDAAGAGLTLCTYTLDVSGTGLQFAYPMPLPTGHIVGVQLRCPAGAVPLAAEVRWQRPLVGPEGDPLYRVGAAIVELASAPRQRLLAFLGDDEHLRIAARD